MSHNTNEKKSPPIKHQRKLSEPINTHEAAAVTLEETLNGLQKVSDMLQASLQDLEGQNQEPPAPPPRVSSSPMAVRKDLGHNNTSTSGSSDEKMDATEMLRTNKPIVQLRSKLSEEMFGTNESSTSSTKQW